MAVPGVGSATLAPGWDADWGWVVPYVFAATAGFQILGFLVLQPQQFGIDASLYAAAAKAWLMGANPWETSEVGVYFAAPPPSLLPYAPFAFMPGLVTSLVWILGSVLIAALAIRSLGAPIWWLLWWPILDACLVGNSNAVILGLLVLVRGRLAALAPLVKIYAFAHVLALGKSRRTFVAVGLLLATALALPWRQYFAALPQITAHLESTSVSTSVFGQPILMAIAGIGLLLLGIRRALWLGVPVLWPYTQVHYMAPSLPAISPRLAIAWSFPHPLVVVASIWIEAFAVRGTGARSLPRRGDT